MKRTLSLLALVALAAYAQEPREPNFMKRMQAVEAAVGTSSELGHLAANCVIGNDSTPIPDACVGDGVDGTGSATVDTANSPNANEFARFTDADTIEGRTTTEVLTDLGITSSLTELNYTDGVTSAIQTQIDTKLASASYTAADVLSKLLTVDGASSLLDADLLDGNSSAAFQPIDSDLTSIAALTTTATGRGLLDDADAAALRASLSLGTASTSASTDFGPVGENYLVGTATAGLSAEIAVGTSPGGELGGTWATPTLDDSVTVDGWTMGASVATSPSANDSDTSLATTAFVQGEIDDGDNLSDNCALEADATPIPTTCLNSGLAPTASPTFTGTVTLPAATVSLAMMADLAQDQFIGRTTGSTGVPQTATITAAARTVLDDTTVAAMRATLLTPTDLVFVATPASPAVNDTNDVTIVTRDVTGVAAGDSIIVDADFTILNNSTATRVYVITLDCDALTDIEFSTGAMATSSTLMHPFHIHAVCDIRASNLMYEVVWITGQVAAGTAAGADTTMAATNLEGMSWGTSTSDATGTTTVALKVRSANATATQTLRLHAMTIRKVTPG